MLNFAPLLEVNIAVLKEDIDNLTPRLIELGIMQFLDIKEVEAELAFLRNEALSQKEERCLELKSRLERLAANLGVGLACDKSTSFSELSPPEIEEKLSQWEKEAAPLVLAKAQKERQLKEKLGIYAEAKLLPPDLSFRGRFSYIHLAVYEIPPKDFLSFKRELASFASVAVPYYEDKKTMRIVIAVMKRDQPLLEAIAGRYNFKKLDRKGLRTLAFKKETEKEINSLRQEIAAQKEKLLKLGQARKKELEAIYAALRKWLVFYQARRCFSHSDYVYFISGWLEQEKEKELKKVLASVCGRRFFYQALPPENLEAVKKGRLKVPVLFRHAFFLKPFESLVKTYGVPAYGTIDPTLLVAVLFVLMFGAMFGDFGQGLVLFFAGLFLLRHSKKNLQKSGFIIASAGLSSAFFGLLYGSVFGFENILPPLWLKPLDNITTLFKITVLFGIFVISGGIIINAINDLRFKDYRDLLFGPSGLISGIIYWSLLGIAIKYFAGLNNYVFILCGIGLALGLGVFLAERPLMRLFLKKEGPQEDMLSYTFEKLVGVLEMFLGYLANTLSFIRIAAFTLAHIGLFIAIFSLADIIKLASKSSFLSWLVIIGGNIFIIILEGLVVTIQVLRLEYYEFFSRFFRRQGEEFRALKIEEE